MGQIHFFTGKGGVGKSTLAMAYALKQAQNGLRTLLVEYSPLNTMTRHLKMPVGFEPQKYPQQKGLSVASWNGEDCLRAYVQHSVKIQFLFETFYKSTAMQALVNAAPALKEISFLGYLTSHFRDIRPSLSFDCIVVDAPATGHFLSCLQVPQAMLDITSMGPMGHHCRGILEVMKDPSKTQIHSVVLPEDLVVAEQEQLSEFLKKYLDRAPNLWLNRSLQNIGLVPVVNSRGVESAPTSDVVTTLASSPPRELVSGNYWSYLQDVLEREMGLRQNWKFAFIISEALATDFLAVMQAACVEIRPVEMGNSMERSGGGQNG